MIILSLRKLTIGYYGIDHVKYELVTSFLRCNVCKESDSLLKFITVCPPPYLGMPTSDPKSKGLQTKRRIIEQFVML